MSVKVPFVFGRQREQAEVAFVEPISFISKHGNEPVGRGCNVRPKRDEGAGVVRSQVFGRYNASPARGGNGPQEDVLNKAEEKDAP